MRSACLFLTLFTLAWCDVARSEETLLLELSKDGGQWQITKSQGKEEYWEVSTDSARTEAGRFQLGSRFTSTSDTLYLDSTAYAYDRVSRLEVVHEGSRVTLQLYLRDSLAPTPLRLSNVTQAGDSVHIEKGRFVRGFVLSFGGPVYVEGEINRSLVCVAGDIHIGAGGVVRGHVVALSGKVHKDDSAFVYGDLYADNQETRHPRWYEDRSQNPVRFNVAFDYNRVTGGLAWASVEAGTRRGYTPVLALDLGYAFGSELWHYRAGIKREVWPGPIYYLGAYRDTRDDDASIIGRNENTIFALLFGLDYRDYYFAEGFLARTGWALSEHRKVTLAYYNESLSPLEANQDQWSLINGGSFPKNYETLRRTGDTSFLADFDGRSVYLSGQGEFQFPEFPDRDRGSVVLDVDWEWSSSDLGSDFDYTRYGGHVSYLQPLWPHQVFRARGSFFGSGGSLPATRYLYLGGIGSLRGFDHKEGFGDRAWFVNAEYGWSLGAIELFALYDAGSVTQGVSFDQSPVQHDVGLGVQIQNTFRLQVARDARFERDALVTFRFTQPF